MAMNGYSFRCLLQFNWLWSLCLQEECANFIRLVEPWNRTQLYVCGTGAYNPVCTFVNRGRKPQVRIKVLRNAQAWTVISTYINSANINSFLHLHHVWHSLTSPFFFLLPKFLLSIHLTLGSLYDFPPSLSLLEVPCLHVWQSSQHSFTSTQLSSPVSC